MAFARDCLFFLVQASQWRAPAAKHQTTVSETNYLLKHENNLYIHAVSKRIFPSMIITCQWENNEQLHETLSPIGGAVEKPKQPSRISHNGEPREQEKETEAAIKLRRKWMKDFTGIEPRVAKRQLHLLQSKNQPLQMAFKTTHRRTKAARSQGTRKL